MEVISKETLKRLPKYLRYLGELDEHNIKNVSSASVAKYFGFTAIQVRKDLAMVSTKGGRPKTGFDVKNLIKDIENKLGYDNITDAVIVGVGNLGETLMSYKGFEKYGINIVTGFDSAVNNPVELENGKKILPASKLGDVVGRLGIKIGIIAVPRYAAQKVADELIEAGIIAIWNFAPKHLHVPKEIIVRNEDLGASLAVLTNILRNNKE